ncbi:MAG TPA: MBL fold metallo-hydrolase [Candidatus Omnitrophota bacterium]|nr:MBL fold metallo-hydrolase [Candidatus Omnitrophota bacterium]HPT07713.1 MBL fold metallo-hydrolase [Candidatus Omnitrophota bacterium]
MARIEKDYLKFLGTAGARFVMIKQLRASGGIWVSCAGTRILIDPGPGSIVRCSQAHPHLDPSLLDGIILTHRHLDHANDINVMIEAMTEGGFKKKGTVFAPSDAFGDDQIILKHAVKFPEKIEIISGEKTFSVGEFTFRTSMRLVHPVETYGLRFKLGGTEIALLADTRYFEGVENFCRADIAIIPVVFNQPRPGIDHLSFVEALEIIKRAKPGKTILTHFGMMMLKEDPASLAKKASKELGLSIYAATDGLAVKC